MRTPTTTTRPHAPHARPTADRRPYIEAYAYLTAAFIGWFTILYFVATKGV